MTYAIIDQSGIVTNTIVWDGEDAYQCAEGCQIRPLGENEIAGIGWLWNGTQYVPPPEQLLPE